MKRPVPVESASALIDEKIKELGDWRGKRGSADVAAVWLRLRPFPWALAGMRMSENLVAMLRTAEEAEIRYLRATHSMPTFWRLP
jgi:hypothetical protein